MFKKDWMGNYKNFQSWMMFTNACIMCGVWSTLVCLLIGVI